MDTQFVQFYLEKFIVDLINKLDSKEARAYSIYTIQELERIKEASYSLVKDIRFLESFNDGDVSEIVFLKLMENGKVGNKKVE